MSNDRKNTTVKPPLYLRDCMEGLLNSEKPDQVEVCITTASTLIRKHSNTVKEVNPQYSLSNCSFSIMYTDGLAALCRNHAFLKLYTLF